MALYREAFPEPEAFMPGERHGPLPSSSSFMTDPLTTEGISSERFGREMWLALQKTFGDEVPSHLEARVHKIAPHSASEEASESSLASRVPLAGGPACRPPQEVLFSPQERARAVKPAVILSPRSMVREPQGATVGTAWSPRAVVQHNASSSFAANLPDNANASDAASSSANPARRGPPPSPPTAAFSSSANPVRRGAPLSSPSATQARALSRERGRDQALATGTDRYAPPNSHAPPRRNSKSPQRHLQGGAVFSRLYQDSKERQQKAGKPRMDNLALPSYSRSSPLGNHPQRQKSSLAASTAWTASTPIVETRVADHTIASIAEVALERTVGCAEDLPRTGPSAGCRTPLVSPTPPRPGARQLTQPGVTIASATNWTLAARRSESPHERLYSAAQDMKTRRCQLAQEHAASEQHNLRREAEQALRDPLGLGRPPRRVKGKTPSPPRQGRDRGRPASPRTRAALDSPRTRAALEAAETPDAAAAVLAAGTAAAAAVLRGQLPVAEERRDDLQKGHDSVPLPPDICAAEAEESPCLDTPSSGARGNINEEAVRRDLVTMKRQLGLLLVGVDILKKKVADVEANEKLPPASADEAEQQKRFESPSNPRVSVPRDHLGSDGSDTTLWPSAARSDRQLSASSDPLVSVPSAGDLEPIMAGTLAGMEAAAKVSSVAMQAMIDCRLQSASDTVGAEAIIAPTVSEQSPADQVQPDQVPAAVLSESAVVQPVALLDGAAVAATAQTQAHAPVRTVRMRSAPAMGASHKHWAWPTSQNGHNPESTELGGKSISDEIETDQGKSNDGRRSRLPPLNRGDVLADPDGPLPRQPERSRSQPPAATRSDELLEEAHAIEIATAEALDEMQKRQSSALEASPVWV